MSQMNESKKGLSPQEQELAHVRFTLSFVRHLQGHFMRTVSRKQRQLFVIEYVLILQMSSAETF